LSDEHISYAARDALAGLDVLHELAKRRPQGSSVTEWCGELLDRAPKLRSSTATGKPVQGQIAGILGCKAFASVTKFGSRRIVDAAGRTMMHMRERTVDGLLRRGLATVAEEDGEEVVRLHFQPKDNYGYAGLDATERNACIGCGTSGVARFYVVPRIFFAHLPRTCKSYNCHDVVMLCPACRAISEPPQLARVAELLAQHGGVRAGASHANAAAISTEHEAAQKAALALLAERKRSSGRTQGATLSHTQPPKHGGPRRRKGQLPQDRAAEFHRIVAVALGLDPAAELSQEDLERAARPDSNAPPPSERVCAAACADDAALRAFLRDWRELFVNVLRPQFLPEGWSVDADLGGRLVPSVAQSVEWPGDWRCERCGVHCFGRNQYCRSCGEASPIAQ